MSNLRLFSVFRVLPCYQKKVTLLPWLFHSRPATEVDAHSLVVDHHVHASVVTVTGSRFAYAVEYLSAHVLDVDDSLERLQVVTAVMTGKEEMDVVLLHIVLNPLGRVHLCRKVGEHQQVGRPEGIATESIMPCLVEERRASRSMAGSKDDLYLATTQVNHLAIVKILDLSLVVTHVIRNDGHVACIQINLREGPYPTHMVAMEWPLPSLRA